MVGMMTAGSRERVASHINVVKLASDIPSKLQHLRQLKDDLSFENDSVLLSDLLPLLLDLHTDRFSPVRKFVTEILGEIGLKHMELLPDIVPVLMTTLKDITPAVCRQVISCGIDLFRGTLVKIAIQGLYSSELDDSLKSSWTWMLKLKDSICSIAFQPENGATRLLALKFVETMILLYTPDPIGSPEAPSHLSLEDNVLEFNISWLRGGHSLLNVRDLSIEASRSLDIMLDQLRAPLVKSVKSPVIIVLINTLSAIATKRPAFYGRVLPVLLGLDPLGSVIKGLHISGENHALKNAFLSCLKCTHPGAAPWRERLIGALREMKAGPLVEDALQQFCKVNGSMAEEENLAGKASDSVELSNGRKRSGVPGISDLVEDDDMSVKRLRSLPTISDGSTKELDGDISSVEQNSNSTRVKSSREDGDAGPVQQLVAMFGALVAQGEKATESLQILISSISVDLLAEVVIANMRHLPPSRPESEEDEEVDPTCGAYVGSDTQVKPPLFSGDAGSLSSAFPLIAQFLDAQQLSSNNIIKPKEKQLSPPALGDGDMVGSSTSFGTKSSTMASSLPVTSAVDLADIEQRSLLFNSEMHDLGNVESGIPGLDFTGHNDELPENKVTSSFGLSDLEGSNQEQNASSGEKSPLELHTSLSTSTGEKSPVELHPSMSTERSEELSPKTAVTDANSILSSTATSVGLSSQLILPKMSAPVVDLTDEQKDDLQMLSYTRIIEAYKQIAVAGGSHARSSLLAYLGVELPLELDPWKLLQRHIISDYLNHDGHELTLRVLYRLYGEAEEEHDFFSSTTATSTYDVFLLTVAETLRDSFPASDKTLSRLLAEVPYLPKSALKLLECLCSPENSGKPEEFLSGDRVTQGLSTVWNLILLRPPIRDSCLKIALQSAVHQLEEVRMKAIRLVANKLYSMSSIAQQIEDFAKEMLLSVANVSDSTDVTNAEVSATEPEKDLNLERSPSENSLASAAANDNASDNQQTYASQNMSSSLLYEAQRCMSLFFALCTKKHGLLRQIFVIYKSASKTVKQAIHRQIPMLVRTVGSSPELLEIISDPPNGSENLLMQVLHTLTDGTIPSQELIFTIKKLYDSKMKDMEILIPILTFLPKDEVLVIFPHLVSLTADKFQAALARLLQGSSFTGPVLTPAEVLIAIHGIDPDRDGIPLKKVTDACNACFEQRQLFTQQVLAKVLNQLVEQIPLPLLFMRTVLQAIGAFPALVDFILEILSRLVTKQIWKYPKLWVGFLKCAQLTLPQSFSVWLQLPPAQLENALTRIAALKAPLIAHAHQPHIRSTLPRSVLVVLGIVPESQSSNQASTPQPETGEVSTADKEVAAGQAKESLSAS
ncbi:Symplekin/Pta1, N-terminal [Dillenia turbinata]|uniref:Symplekin/Pta1, N-terminal n=1 Tax=Dillenia turbinata TaxID=194707 RepID=A0AAN8ZQL0_9MAGN